MLRILGKGENFPLSALKGKVVLLVNTASKCGLKGQLKQFNDLYKSVNASHPNSFVVLAFPSDHFNQEPKKGQELQQYCEATFGVTFPLMGQIGLNGQPMKPEPGKEPIPPKVDGGDALFEWMKQQKAGWFGVRRIKWNFEKFLVGKDGKVKQRYDPWSSPKGLESDILAQIKA